MNNLRILVVDRFPANFLDSLGKLSGKCRFLLESKAAEALEALPWAEVLIVNSKIRLDRAAIDSAPDLKLVCRAGVGLDHIDQEYLVAKGIRLVNTPGANARPVGEQAIGMLVGLMHRIYPANSEVRNFEWKREANRGTELGGKTVGIIGYGNTGRAFAACASGFGVRQLAFDKYKSGFSDALVMESNMNEIFLEADILTLHVPLTEETHFLANDEFFARFRKPIWFLNLSRGPVVKTRALVDALKEGKVLGAGLDVLEVEKFASMGTEFRADFEALREMDNVILTPHVGGWSHESLRRINDRLLEAVASL